MPTTAYLSLGSNIGDRAANMREAVRRLGEVGEVTAVSNFYETEPVDYLDQPWFLNAALVLRTELSAHDLLRNMLAIELAMGRERTVPKGPRSIDLDLLLFGDQIIHEPGLHVPHPAMHLRQFVLEPLAEIAPEVLHPVFHLTISQLRNQIEGNQPVVRRSDESQ